MSSIERPISFATDVGRAALGSLSTIADLLPEVSLSGHHPPGCTYAKRQLTTAQLHERHSTLYVTINQSAHPRGRHIGSMHGSARN